MPGVTYGPIKPTAMKLGKPNKMLNNLSKPKPAPKPKMIDKLSAMKQPKSRVGKGLGKPHMPKGTAKNGSTGFDGLSEL